MSTWKSIVGGIIAATAFLTVAGSTLDDAWAVPPGTDRIVIAVATFVSIVALHWLLWRFIVPSTAELPADVASLFRSQSRRGFLSGTMAFGYVQVALYCAELSDYLQLPGPRNKTMLLIMGLALIALGTATRLRTVIATLSDPPERDRDFPLQNSGQVEGRTPCGFGDPPLPGKPDAVR
jgi:hypothetical protein